MKHIYYNNLLTHFVFKTKIYLLYEEALVCEVLTLNKNSYTFRLQSGCGFIIFVPVLSNIWLKREPTVIQVVSALKQHWPCALCLVSFICEYCSVRQRPTGMHYKCYKLVAALLNVLFCCWNKIWKLCCNLAFEVWAHYFIHKCV